MELIEENKFAELQRNFDSIVDDARWSYWAIERARKSSNIDKRTLRGAVQGIMNATSRLQGLLE